MNVPTTDRTNILVLHPDPLLRVGLAAVLRYHATFAVFVDDELETLTNESRIDVAITDYGQAMQLAKASVRAARPLLAEARVVAVTCNDREADIRRAIEAGVHGYILLGGPLSDVVEGAMSAAKGARYLCRSVAQRMADSLSRASLTSREVEVLRLVMAGEANKAIARRLHIELATVKSHMTTIMAKLGATSRTQAAGIAASRGLVEEELTSDSAPYASGARLGDIWAQYARFGQRDSKFVHSEQLNTAGGVYDASSPIFHEQDAVHVAILTCEGFNELGSLVHSCAENPQSPQEPCVASVERESATRGRR